MIATQALFCSLRDGLRLAFVAVGRRFARLVGSLHYAALDPFVENPKALPISLAAVKTVESLAKTFGYASWGKPGARA
jgi:hypothetical protein